jgi:hypothetical protein
MYSMEYTAKFSPEYPMFPFRRGRFAARWPYVIPEELAGDRGI